MKAHDDQSDRVARAGYVPSRDEQGAAAAAGSRRPHAGPAASPAAVLHLQRTAGNAAVTARIRAHDSSVLDVLAGSGGRPLDDGVRREMEGAFAQDFSHVRVHTGAAASQSAASLDARAYTVGSDIAFQGSQYSPGTTDGKALLAHELTHVVQQRQGQVDGTPMAEGIAVSSPTDRFERAAEATAASVMTKLADSAGLSRSRSAAPEAVAQRQPRASASRVTVQRNKESAQLLKKLATPKVGTGPAIDVQTNLVNELEKLLAGGKWPFGVVPSELNLGGILVDRLPDGAPNGDEGQEDAQLFEKLIGGGAEQSGPAARFVELPTNAQSGGVSINAQVNSEGLGPRLVENSLKTMIDAQQFAYLRLAGLPNAAWKILVEVHYIRARPKDMAGLHKDTRGQTLFVNLNYHVQDREGQGQAVRGPEYVLNPLADPEHDKLLGVGQAEGGTLPKEFTSDLGTLRQELEQPDEIRLAGAVQPYGYVAFVDEAIHHATPFFGHRYVIPSEFKGYLERNHKAQLDEIRRAEQSYRDRWTWFSTSDFAKYVDAKIIPPEEIDRWRTWLKMSDAPESTAKRTPRYTRDDFAKTMATGKFEEMLEDVGSQPGAERQAGGAGGWSAASIPHPGNSRLAPLKPGNKPPLKRRASNADLTKDLPEQLPDDVDRRFLRCWVRAIPEDLAAQLRG